MTTRNELITILSQDYNINLFMSEELADFILEDRKRILEPIKESRRFYNNVKFGTVSPDKMVNELVYSIEATLKLAGVE